MNIVLQYKLKSNPNYIRYLRENSNWYKYLNRNPESIKYLIRDMKDKYKLNTSDKISKTVDNLQLIQSFLNILK